MQLTSDTLTILRRRLADELAGYGQYLAMRGAREGEQRLGVVELALSALLLTAWSAKEYLSAYLQEKGRLHAGDSPDAADLEAHLQALLAELQAAQRDRAVLEAQWSALLKSLDELEISRSSSGAVELDGRELAMLLRALGLTEHAAGRVTREIVVAVRETLD